MLFFVLSSSTVSDRIINLSEIYFRTIRDRLGEAKASGNLGNTLKVLGRFDEAVVCCQRHLDIAQDLHDKAGSFMKTLTSVVLFIRCGVSYKVL